MATVARPSDNNFETFSIVWLDESINKSKENIDAQQRLQSSINHLIIFEQNDECEQHIRSLSGEERIVLIVSGRSGQRLVPRIHQIQQVSSIYVYCMDKQKNVRWGKQFIKVKGVLMDLDEIVALIEFIQSNERKKKIINEPLSITIIDRNHREEKSTTGINGQFVHSQLLIDCLLRMESSETDKKQLVSVCQEEYHGNSGELAILREFQEDYSGDRSLWWYTRDSFVYRLLNKALRVQNIELLFLFRFFIRDLSEQLEKYRCSSPLTVYRGQLMSKNELMQLEQSLGEFISINSFFSTSLDRDLALFLLTDSAPSNDLERVLFEINADPRLDTIKPFADISSFSFFPNEKEVLFMLGSIFWLINIRHNQDGVWVIRLTLFSDHYNHLKSIFDHMKNQHGHDKTTFHSFGNVLHRMGKFDEAKKYYCHYLHQLSPRDHQNIGKCYYSLGRVAKDKGEYELSLEWFHKSLEIRMRTQQPNDPDLEKTHNAIANVYTMTGDYPRALESYNKALLILKLAFGEDHLDIATYFNNMGVIYQRKKKYSKALNYYERALAIRQKHLPAYHPRLGRSHNNIGNVYRLLGHSDLALEHYKLSLKISNKSLPPEHPSIAMTLANIGNVHENNGKWQKHCLTMKKQPPSIEMPCRALIPTFLKSSKIFYGCYPEQN